MMNFQSKKMLRRIRSRSGQSVFEYAIILAVIAMVCVLILRGIGRTTSNSMTPVNTALN